MPPKKKSDDIPTDFMALITRVSLPDFQKMAESCGLTVAETRALVEAFKGLK